MWFLNSLSRDDVDAVLHVQRVHEQTLGAALVAAGRLALGALALALPVDRVEHAVAVDLRRRVDGVIVLLRRRLLHCRCCPPDAGSTRSAG